MPSNTVGSPLSSIFQQWTLQQLQLQQKQQEAQQHRHHATSFVYHQQNHYNILFQRSFSLSHRVRAAEPVENEHVYRHAGVRTPAETAVREARAGQAWTLRLLELAVTARQSPSPSKDRSEIDTSDVNDPITIVWVSTETVTISPVDCLPEELRRRIHVIDLSSHNPFGWDDDDNDDENQTSIDDKRDKDDNIVETSEKTSSYSMNDLSRLFHQMRDKLCSIRKPVIIVWQSLMPLFLFHGFKKTLCFLSRLTLSSTEGHRNGRVLPTCLQVWPVDKEGLTSQQHSELEELSHAILFFKSGEVTVMRRGVRERDNLLRDILPYNLVRDTIPPSATTAKTTAGLTPGRMYYRVEEYISKPIDKGDTKNTPTAASVAADMESITLDEGRKKNDKRDNTKETGRSTGRSGVALRLEDDDEKKQIVRPKQRNDHQRPQQSRPRIFLEDDDPDFADLDEDDPDDDLDL
jgi:hypothetical protein